MVMFSNLRSAWPATKKVARGALPAVDRDVPNPAETRLRRAFLQHELHHLRAAPPFPVSPFRF
jgi:hypothetical protein